MCHIPPYSRKLLSRTSKNVRPCVPDLDIVAPLENIDEEHVSVMEAFNLGTVNDLLPGRRKKPLSTDV